MNYEEFKELVWEKGRELYRDMPWRQDTRPYYVLVSELMLQQTQVDRVIPKFNAFIAAFPSIDKLASASLSDVLTLWNGLGYNRRAKFLHMAAQAIVQRHGGVVPSDTKELVDLPGVGPNTAGAIRAYGFNLPAHFIETNVRTVYFYHLFQDQTDVSDKELLHIVEETADREHPREWHWALMDYGTFLKKNGAGGLSKSKHYKKQSMLKGSLREVRGMILRELTADDAEIGALKGRMPADERFEVAVESLISDGLITKKQHILRLSE